MEKDNEQLAHRNRGHKEPKSLHEKDPNKQLMADFRKVLSTPAGVNVFQWIMNECGFKETNIVRQVTISEDGKRQIFGDILPLSSTYNESKRDVWITIRKNIPPHLLNNVEREKEYSDEEKKSI